MDETTSPSGDTTASTPSAPAPASAPSPSASPAPAVPSTAPSDPSSSTPAAPAPPQGLAAGLKAATATATRPPSAGEKPPPGPIPFDRHEAILRTAREKARRDAQADTDRTYGWAKGLDPSSITPKVQLFDRFAADPVGFARQVLAEAAADPRYAQALQAPTPAETDAEPPPDLQAEGQAWYSAAQQQKWAQWNKRQTLKEVTAEFAPLREEMDRVKQERAQGEMKTAAAKFAQTTYQQLSAYPHFETHRAEIAKVLGQMDLGPTATDADVNIAVRDAYFQVLRDHVFPTLEGTAQKKLLSDLDRHAAAGTKSPTGPSTRVNGAAAPLRFRDELAKAIASR